MSIPSRAIPSRLGQAAPAENAVTTLYTVPNSSAWFPDLTTLLERVRILSLYVINRDPQSEADAVTVWIVPSGWSPTEANVLVNNYTLTKWEELLKTKIILHQWDTVQIRSSKWISTFHMYGEFELYTTSELDSWGRIVHLQNLVRDWTASAAEKEELVLLLGWAIQNNSNVCNAP